MGRAMAWLAVTAALAGGCSALDVDDRGEGPRPISAAEVEGNARVHLPPGTVLLSTAYQGFQDWHLTAAFRMPSTALPGFLHASGFGEPTPGLRPVTNSDRAGSDTWKPDAATTVAGVNQTGSPVDGVYRRLLLDQGRPGEVTVYLVAFTM